MTIILPGERAKGEILFEHNASFTVHTEFLEFETALRHSFFLSKYDDRSSHYSRWFFACGKGYRPVIRFK